MNKKLLSIITLSSAALIANELYTTRNDCTLRDGRIGTIYELEMGDESCDGHCLTKTRTICSPLSNEDMNAAYKSGSEILGFNFITDVAAEYEDSSLSMEKLTKLRSHNIATWKFEDEEYAEEGEVLESVGLNPENYSEIYLEIIKLGNPDFSYETLEGKNISIGGYGLFSI